MCSWLLVNKLFQVTLEILSKYHDATTLFSKDIRVLFKGTSVGAIDTGKNSLERRLSRHDPEPEVCLNYVNFTYWSSHSCGLSQRIVITTLVVGHATSKQYMAAGVSTTCSADFMFMTMFRVSEPEAYI